MRIALISCSKEKKKYSCPAHELYSASALFSASYAYAKKQADKIYILSAKYGLVHENDIIEPYDQTLKNMSRREQLQWAQKVLEEMRSSFRVDVDEFIILAGKDYYQYLIPALPHYSLPLGNLLMGERISWLNRENAQPGNCPSRSSRCEAQSAPADMASISVEIHALANGMHRYAWDTIAEIPFSNGIYLVFEKGEKYRGFDRIVRVGTHTSQGRLKKRLLDHFVHENHDGSIFRKNIGKAMLNGCSDPYLYNWTMDTSRPENAAYRDEKKNAEIEARVSRYLKESFSFAVFPVGEKAERLRLEEAIISALHRTDDFTPSEKWAGRFSPEPEIRQSGMWLKRGLDAVPLTTEELMRIRRYCAPSPERGGMAKVPDKVKNNAPQIRITGSHGKYTPLYEFLSQRQEARVELSFDELERILGAKLPPSATKYAMWWSGHAHCRAWTDAGYRVADIQSSLTRRTAVFTRDTNSRPLSPRMS